MMELTVDATVENLDTVTDFVNGQLEQAGCSPKVIMQTDLAVEEIYVNIAHYAYHPKTGKATIRCAVGGDPLQVAAMHCRPGERRSESSGRHSELTASLISVNIVGNKAGPEIALVAHRPHHAAERLSGPA